MGSWLSLCLTRLLFTGLRSSLQEDSLSGTFLPCFNSLWKVTNVTSGCSPSSRSISQQLLKSQQPPNKEKGERERGVTGGRRRSALAGKAPPRNRELTLRTPDQALRGNGAPLRGLSARTPPALLGPRDAPATSAHPGLTFGGESGCSH